MIPHELLKIIFPVIDLVLMHMYMLRYKIGFLLVFKVLVSLNRTTPILRLEVSNGQVSNGPDPFSSVPLVLCVVLAHLLYRVVSARLPNRVMLCCVVPFFNLVVPCPCRHVSNQVSSGRIFF